MGGLETGARAGCWVNAMAPYLLFPSWTAGCFDELRLTRRGEAASAILGALEAVAYQGRGVWRQVMGFS